MEKSKDSTALKIKHSDTEGTINTGKKLHSRRGYQQHTEPKK